VGVDVAVGQGEAADASRVARREDLDDRTSAVVADDVHLLQSQALAERLEHLGLATDGDVGVGWRAGGAVAEQVDRDAAARVGDAVDDVAPEIVVQEDAVDEERGGSAAALRVSDVSDRGGCVLQVGSYHDALLLPLGWEKARALDRM